MWSRTAASQAPKVGIRSFELPEATNSMLGSTCFIALAVSAATYRSRQRACDRSAMGRPLAAKAPQFDAVRIHGTALAPQVRQRRAAGVVGILE